MYSAVGLDNFEVHVCIVFEKRTVGLKLVYNEGHFKHYGITKFSSYPTGKLQKLQQECLCQHSRSILNSGQTIPTWNEIWSAFFWYIIQ
jgi:hypothetical protein